MTEQEWLTSKDPVAMLESLPPFEYHGGKYDRKLRLFACACRRQMGSMPWDGQSKGWSFMEDHPEEQVLANAIGPSLIPAIEHAMLFLSDDVKGRPEHSVSAAILRDIVGNPFRRQKWSKCKYCHDDGWKTHYDHDSDSKIRLPCRHCGPSKTVIGIADTIYNERDFGLLPMLADAIDESGYGTVSCPCMSGDNPRNQWTGIMPALWKTCSKCNGVGNVPTPLIEHLRERKICIACRGTGGLDADHRKGMIECRACEPWGSGTQPLNNPHFRGCWAIDLILGKS